MSLKLRLAIGSVVVLLVPSLAWSAAKTARSAASVEGKLDVPPAATQKPYAPAWQEVVPVNPPPFIWVPVGKGAVYTLQVSRSKDFPPGDTLTFEGIPTSVFVPRKTFDPGDWHWRYGASLGGETAYGKARPFTVPADARPFPFPDFDKALRGVAKKRPRLFFPGKRLEAIRQAAAGPLKADVETLCRRCDRAIGRDLVAEPPRPKTGPERVHVMRTTRPPMDEMEQCALAYLLTGKREYGDEAKRRLLHFFSWDPEGSTNLWSYDEPAMWVMMRGTRAYDWTYDLFAPSEREKVEPVMKARAEHFYRHLKRRPFESNPYESHAGRMPGFLGEAALSFAHEWPEARGWLEYATLLYYTSYPAWGGDDGGWQEGPGYWSAYMSFALHYVAALRNATGIDLAAKPFFQNTPYYALYTATPYHEHRPFGDGATGSPRGLGHVMYAFSTLAQNPHFRWYHRESGLSVGSSLLTLATYDPHLQAKSPEGLPPARLFPAVGLAAFHTALGDKENDVTFLFRSSPYGGVSHGHADQNAFVVEAFGRGVALATGYYPWYGSPHHHNWTRATRSVNSVLVDGEGQAPRSWDAKGEITAFRSVEGYDYVEGEAAPAYGGRLKQFRRHVVHVRPGIFVIFDRLAAAKPATFQWLLHAHEKIGIEGRTLTVRREPAAMDVHILLPAQVRLSQTDAYDPEPETVGQKRATYQKTWHLTAETPRPAETAEFLTVLLVHKKGRQAQLPQVRHVDGAGAVGVHLSMPDGSAEVVAFRTDTRAAEVSCGGLTSRGRVFARGRDPSGKTIRNLDVGDTD